MQVNEAVDRLLAGDNLETVVEDFKFQNKAREPRVIGLEFDRSLGGNVIAAPLDTTEPQCGGVQDFRNALMAFAKEAKKFLDSRGLSSIGKPFMCGDRFVWKFRHDPKKEPTFKPKEFGEPGKSRMGPPPKKPRPLFSPEDRARAARIRAKNKPKETRSFLARLFDL